MVLVLIVVIASVGVRSGLLVTMAVPFSFFFAFIIISMLGFTYNFMVIFGLLLGLGMLIDGAIVMVEYADRKMAEGLDSQEAYKEAVARMFWPIMASTATTLAAFLPIMFWPGVAGQFMSYLPITVFAVLIGSLFYALLFAPTIGALLGASTAASEDHKQNLETGDPHKAGPITGLYADVLEFAVARPIAIFFTSIAVMVSIVIAYGMFGRGVEFFTSVEPNQTQVQVFARGNYSPAELRDIMLDVEDRIRSVGHIKGIVTQSGAGQQMGGDGKQIQLELSGDDLDQLFAEATRIRTYFEEEQGTDLIDIDDTAPVPGIEWEIVVDRARAAMLGANMSEVGAAIQLMTNGIFMGDYRPNDSEEEVDIRVRYPAEYRGRDQLDSIRISTTNGPVPISSFVTVEAKPQVSSIQRVDGERVVYVRANPAPGIIADNKLQEISAWLEANPPEPGVFYQFRGANEEQAESAAFLGQAFSLALALMAILLVTQFNSYYQALLILSSVLLSTTGVLLGLLTTGQTFSVILTGIGIVALAGIIVNNNIVLIDTFNVLRGEHPEWTLQEVIVQTGVQRLRPVFLTTFTTGFGLLPLAMHVSIDLIGAEVEVGGPITSQWVSLASAIVFGLSFGTILTLIVTPAMLALPDRLREVIRAIPRPGRKPEAVSTQ